ncbi:unnamed protein product, partial [Sphagnum tenellum]
SMENRRARQQADNLVWQQEAFHKILKLQGLLKEGLICKAELQLCRKEILQVVAAVHPDGEWANFTRDKLLFLQDLLREGCISEAEYHATKQPILSRLAEQGAELDSQDFVMLVSPPPPSGTVGHDAPDCRASLIAALEAAATASQKSSNTNTEEYSPIRKMGPPDSTTTRKTPIKQVLEAMSRIKNNKANWCVRLAPFSFYAHVPVIDQDDDEEAMYAASPVKKLSASPSLGHRRMGDMLSGLVRKLQGESVLPNEAYSPLNTEEESPQLDEDGKIPQTGVLDTRVLREGSNGQGPDTVKLKKKVDTRGPPTNFFIDKVLGDNIKAELTRIRAEMSESSPGQTFTNEQIEAIATRLPVDKVELQRFFPKSWCDRYGDVVLEVVHKEFKDHVGEMENQRKAGKLKRAASKAAKEKELAAFTKNENDENSGHPNISNVLLQSPKTGAAFVKRSPKTSLNQCFTTTGATLVESKAKLPLIEEQPEGDVVRNCRSLGFDKELDGKLTAEILRMPSKRFNDVSGLR